MLIQTQKESQFNYNYVIKMYKFNLQYIMEKVQNVRLNKWIEMLQTGLHKDPEKLKERIAKGIPISIRSKAWPAIVNLDKFKS